MTRDEAWKILSRYVVHGGIYRYNYIFVFDSETFDLIIKCLAVFDGSDDSVWATHDLQFKMAGVTAHGRVRGRFEGYCVIGARYHDGLIFAPNYAKEFIDTLAHEAAHVAQFVLPTEAPHDTWVDKEPLAYLTGWLVQEGLRQLASQKGVTAVFSPMSNNGANGRWNQLFKRLYSYGDNERLVNYMSALDTVTLNSIVRDHAHKQLNHTVHVDDEGWTAVTFLDGKKKK